LTCSSVFAIKQCKQQVYCYSRKLASTVSGTSQLRCLRTASLPAALQQQ
jgi:hypothetical protein